MAIQLVLLKYKFRPLILVWVLLEVLRISGWLRIKCRQLGRILCGHRRFSIR